MRVMILSGINPDDETKINSMIQGIDVKDIKVNIVPDLQGIQRMHLLIMYEKKEGITAKSEISEPPIETPPIDEVDQSGGTVRGPGKQET